MDSVSLSIPELLGTEKSIDGTSTSGKKSL